MTDAACRPRLIVEAVVIRACPHCGDSRVRDGNHVPGNCPGCGQECPEAENKGIIFDTWEKLKEWWGFQ